MSTFGPSLVVTANTMRRKLVYAWGMWWAFYQPDVHGWYYKTSSDGINWSAATLFMNPFDGNDVFMYCWLDGTTLHTCYTMFSPTYYRMAHLNPDGTFTWAAAATQVSIANANRDQNLHIICDSAGYPIIRYTAVPSLPNYHITIIKSTTKDGTWNPVTLYDVNYSSLTAGTNIPLSQLKLYMTIAGNTGVLSGELYESIWQVDSLFDTNLDVPNGITNRGDVVDLAYNKASPYPLLHATRNPKTGLWTITTIASPTDNIVYSNITSFGPNLALIWAQPNTSHIYYSFYNNGWLPVTDWLDESADTIPEYIDFAPFHYATSQRQVGFLYATKGIAPYNIKFAGLTIPAFNDYPMNEFYALSRSGGL